MKSTEPNVLPSSRFYLATMLLLGTALILASVAIIVANFIAVASEEPYRDACYHVGGKIYHDADDHLVCAQPVKLKGF